MGGRKAAASALHEGSNMRMYGGWLRVFIVLSRRLPVP